MGGPTRRMAAPHWTQALGHQGLAAPRPGSTACWCQASRLVLLGGGVVGGGGGAGSWTSEAGGAAHEPPPKPRLGPHLHPSILSTQGAGRVSASGEAAAGGGPPALCGAVRGQQGGCGAGR